MHLIGVVLGSYIADKDVTIMFDPRIFFLHINAIKCKHFKYNQLVLFEEQHVCDFKCMILKINYQFLILTFIRHIRVSATPNSTSSDSV